MAYTTIDDPSAYFHTQLYSGDGGGSNAITNDANAGDFKPDWLWIKERTSTSSNTLVDSTRGAGNILLSDSTNAEASAPAVSSLNTDGFTLGSDGKTNEINQNYVAWQWKANGGTTSTNNDGTVSVTLQANTTAGFSIGLWTSDGTTSGTIGHGLGARPDMVITKERNDTGNWNVIVPDYASNQMSQLNTTNAFSVASGINTVGTSTFTDGDGADGNTRVFYAFKSIQGYSKIGVYTGNGSTDGSFIYTGFKPAWVMIKRADAANNWNIFDNKRDVDNQVGNLLYANLSNAEDADASHSSGNDFLSNGFKLRETGNAINGSGATYIYLAFAEHPFVGSDGVPTTAR